MKPSQDSTRNLTQLLLRDILRGWPGRRIGLSVMNEILYQVKKEH